MPHHRPLLRIEGRRAPRRPAHVEISYSDGTRLYSDYTRDISPGGVQIETSRQPPADPRLVVSFQLAGQPVKLQGTIRWIRRDGLAHRFGVEFVAMLPEDRERLDALMCALAPETPGREC
ncbi:PilZ domain-containing protein [Dissulfurirhabdus thermomarina]|uniref:PilZ domain-containing protein n=1 Tax=Dissulfurirhabdus thermomarina TaxID=1765737 RepID=A0A6N9TPA5_DISTH|nr:PilZ domain-containing protein [Dissulfurirhabdus thermomarina]NDY42989.1 PilZ domain-containing protein [Dissulfurirhabdus thermomarina]NMX22719.1 PilZ domain-containing protein [Dissulfurirhabdus thermomarina]